MGLRVFGLAKATLSLPGSEDLRMDLMEVLLLIFGFIALLQLNAIRRLLMGILTELLSFKTGATDGLQDFKKALTKQLTVHGTDNFASGLQEWIGDFRRETTEELQIIAMQVGEIKSDCDLIHSKLVDIDGELGSIERNTTPISHKDPLL